MRQHHTLEDLHPQQHCCENLNLKHSLKHWTLIHSDGSAAENTSLHTIAVKASNHTLQSTCLKSEVHYYVSIHKYMDFPSSTTIHCYCNTATYFSPPTGPSLG